MTNLPILINGVCDPGFAAVREEFERNFRERGEVGAAVCVYRDGRKVVDLWGGHKDMERTVPWAEDTIVIMNSVAKSMCALCTHILIDRGLVDFDAPVSRYWPEFAAAGKEGVLVRHVLSHTCGVIYCDHAPPGSWFDWKVHIRALEQQAPAWEPGTKGAYNSINIGYILGEIVRRVTGKSVGNFLREEVAGKLGADYHIGLRPDEIARVSDMHRNPKNAFFKIAFDDSTPLGRAFRSAPKMEYFQNCREIRELEVASFGGHGNARAMARIYAMLAGNGIVDGVRILSASAVERAVQTRLGRRLHHDSASYSHGIRLHAQRAQHRAHGGKPEGVRTHRHRRCICMVRSRSQPVVRLLHQLPAGGPRHRAARRRAQRGSGRRQTAGLA